MAEAPKAVAPAPKPAPAPAKPAATEEALEDVVVTSTCTLRDPHTGTWFNANVPTEAKLTGWLKSQIEAGLMEKG